MTKIKVGDQVAIGPGTVTWAKEGCHPTVAFRICAETPKSDEMMPWHPALPALARWLHGQPQGMATGRRLVIHEIRPCEAPGCDHGKWSDGSDCSVCNGTGEVDWNLGEAVGQVVMLRSDAAALVEYAEITKPSKELQRMASTESGVAFMRRKWEVEQAITPELLARAKEVTR